MCVCMCIYIYIYTYTLYYIIHNMISETSALPVESRSPPTEWEPPTPTKPHKSSKLVF